MTEAAKGNRGTQLTLPPNYNQRFAVGYCISFLGLCLSNWIYFLKWNLLINFLAYALMGIGICLSYSAIPNPFRQKGGTNENRNSK